MHHVAGCLMTTHVLPSCCCSMLELGLYLRRNSIIGTGLRSLPRPLQAVKDCFVGAKDAGFKVVCHMMPDLPNVGWERDLECFREFFENPEFRWAAARRPQMQVDYDGVQQQHIMCWRCWSVVHGLLLASMRSQKIDMHQRL
jgi:hypothetical protein